jgi:predicted DsbA family dithiol-disulfide isomerase
VTAKSPERDEGMRRAVEAAGTLVQPLRRPVITFVADLVCPWCYIAFVRLQRVLAGSAATLAWHPFLLNPYLPARGVPRRLYLERKFGSVTQAHGVHRRAVEAGAKEGIDFAFGAITAQPNTIQAHALVLAAARRGRGSAVASALFRAFFVDGADLGSDELLARVARQVGLVAGSVGELTAPELERVRLAHEQAHALGIAGVPVCRFGTNHLIAGAQPEEVLAALLDLESYRLASADEGQGRQAS